MASSILAVLFSAFVPGLGQFYCGRFLRGVSVFIVFSLLSAMLAGLGIILMITVIIPILLALLLVAFWVWNLFDAYNLAQRT